MADYCDDSVSLAAFAKPFVNIFWAKSATWLCKVKECFCEF